MRNAKIIVAITVAGLTLAACQKQKPAQDQNIAIDEGIPDNQMAGNADIETLPADESSTTPSGQLQNGFDNPDVNEAATPGNTD